MADKKTAVLAHLVRAAARPLDGTGRALIVGCGKGFEAVDFADLLHCKVDAIDIYDQVCVEHPSVVFHVMDAQQMSFPDGVFDVVYSFHALEHTQQPQLAITEMSRVLKDGGVLCIGTPNRSRLFSYISSRDTTFKRKIALNLVDWGMRFRGRFRNEYGAHAGFTFKELCEFSWPEGPCVPVTRKYYEGIYPRQAWFIDLAIRTHIADWILPAHYLLVRKSGTVKLI